VAAKIADGVHGKDEFRNVVEAYYLSGGEAEDRVPVSAHQPESQFRSEQ
jgi:hypothetical protein